MKNSKKLTMPVCKLEDVPALKEKQLEFESVAQMFTVRSQEVPDKTHVIFYDEKITYAQTNERANKVANYLKEVGFPDEGLGERVKAVIEPLESKTLTREIIREYLKDKLAHYKIPELVEVTDSLPRNQTGKLLKFKLKENEW